MMNKYEYLYGNNEPVKKRLRRGTRTAIAVVCCLALMIGSGYAGVKIAEGRYNGLQDNNTAAQTNIPVADVSGNNGSAESSDNSGSMVSTEPSGNAEPAGNTDPSGSAAPLGGINPGGGILSLTELFIGADPAVVAISTEMTGQNVFGRIVTLPAAGSGFIISQDGYIVTNNHVVEDATSISVLLNDGTKYPAELVGRDPVSDLAVLKIDANGLSYLTWGNSDDLQVGEQVAAIGNPLGEFANSMTVGYISALDREIDIDGTPRKMLQTDAALNSGNSGGPLLNLKGQVIGVVTAKSGGSNVEGLGFAIPSNKVESVVKTLINIGAAEGFGYIRKQAVMGVTVSTQEENNNSSIHVESVNPGSAAEKAGVKEGDIILSANGTAVKTVNELKRVINNLYPGDKLDLLIQRNGKDIALSVILDESTPTDSTSQTPNGNQFPNFPGDGSDTPFDPEDIFPGFWERLPQE